MVILREILNPEKRPKDSDDRSLPIDKRIDLYALEEFKVRFVTNLDKFIEQDFGNDHFRITMPDYVISCDKLEQVVAKSRENELKQIER